MKTIATGIILASVALAETQEKHKPPEIPAALQAEYFRADGVVAKLKPSGWDEAVADVQKAVIDLQKACGDKFTVSMVDRKLVCVTRPTEPAKPEK
jgi:hypothetical protein